MGMFRRTEGPMALTTASVLLRLLIYVIYFTSSSPISLKRDAIQSEGSKGSVMLAHWPPV